MYALLLAWWNHQKWVVQESVDLQASGTLRVGTIMRKGLLCRDFSGVDSCLGVIFQADSDISFSVGLPDTDTADNLHLFDIHTNSHAGFVWG